MGGVVSSTADVLAILGGTTTLVLGIFGAVRYSRCRSVSCCWGACKLTNAPPGEKKDPGPRLIFGPDDPPSAVSMSPTPLAPSELDIQHV